MLKPKNMTPEQDAVWRKKVAAWRKAYREANLEKVAARMKAYREANSEKVAAQRKAYREANREKLAAHQKARYEANRENMSDSYLTTLFNVPRRLIPADLLELKRQQILLERITAQLNQTVKEKTNA